MVKIDNSQVKEMVVKSYFRRLTTGKLDKGIDKNPGVLITGWTGTGKSTGVYEAAEEIADILGKKLFIYGKDKIEVDIDELSYKYQQMYEKISKITGRIVKNGKIPEIDQEILAGIVRDTFMDLSLDEIFDILDAVSMKNVEPPEEYIKLKEERNMIMQKVLNDKATLEDFDRLGEIEKKIKEYREKAVNGIFVFVDFDLNQVESVDMTGVIVKTSVGFRYLPPLWALLLKRHGGILFLDEFTNIESNEKRSVAYRIVFSKKIGEIFLDRRVLVVAAGNTTKDSSIAGELPWPLLNRFANFQIDAINKKEIINYFIKKYGHSKAALKVISFLAASSDTVLFNLPKTETRETLEPFETPRSWEFIIRDIMALNGDIEPESDETKILLDLYGLKPGDLVEKAQGNIDIGNLVASIAEEYVSPSVAQTLGTQWIERVISPEELFKNPKIFKELYGNIKHGLSMAALQTVFMYGQWLSVELPKEIEKVLNSGSRKRYSEKKIDELKKKVLPKYIEPIKVIAEVNTEYVTFLIGLIAAMGTTVNNGTPLHIYLLIGFMDVPEIYNLIKSIAQKIVFRV